VTLAAKNAVSLPKINEPLTEFWADPLKLALGRANRCLSGADLLVCGRTERDALWWSSGLQGQVYGVDLNVLARGGGYPLVLVTRLLQITINGIRVSRQADAKTE
jgi:hypothetical protein